MGQAQHSQAEAHSDLSSSAGSESVQWGPGCPAEDWRRAELWGTGLKELQDGLDPDPQMATGRRNSTSSEHTCYKQPQGK